MEKKIKNFYLQSSTGKDDDSFVGIKTIGNSVYLFYPECFDLDIESKTWQKDAIALLSTIKIAKSFTKDKSSFFKQSEKDNDFALKSYLWIISDYLQNGLYVNKEKRYCYSQNGRINWKRTFQTKPFLTNNGKIVYLDIVSEVKNTLDNLLVEIYKVCVKKSIDFIGWLFNLDSTTIIVPQFSNTRKQEYISALNEELDKTFDDEKKNRLTEMRNIIEGLDSKNCENDFVYGVDNYYYIFERMVDFLFNGETNISKFYPKGKWVLKKFRDKVFDSSNLRPDTIIIKKNGIKTDMCIVDSKFYRFGTTGMVSDLPETTSIQKQITYGEYIRKNIHDIVIDHIYNVFIIPFNKKSGPYKSNENIIYIGNAFTTWKEKNSEGNLIYTFLVDLKYLVFSWYKHNRFNEEKNLFTRIEHLICEQDMVGI